MVECSPSMAHHSFRDLEKLMQRLRRDCPWDRRQTHRSLLKHLKEEAGEVAQAVRRGDMNNLREELGDLLLQVVFHATLAREKKHFTLGQVVDGLCRKLIRRHPHVFGGKKLTSAREVTQQWRAIKVLEKKRR